MANPYTSVSISGYNASPPADDGTEVDSNKLNWVKHKTKLADPIKTLAEAMDVNILAAFVKRFSNTITSHAADYTMVAGDEGKVLSFTGTRTFTLLAAATVGAGFNSIVHNAGTGVITIDGNGSETIDGEITLTINNQYDTVIITCDGSNWLTISKPQLSLPTSHIGGLVTSNGTDADHDIDIAVGKCRDDADGENLALTSALTKQIDAAWAVGSAAGGLDTGAAAEALYAIWLIKRTDTNVVDALFSLSFTAPTMPTNYDTKRLIGFVKTDGSFNILPFEQSGDLFWFVDAVTDVNDATITDDTFETGTFSVPPNSLAYLVMNLSGVTTTNYLVFLRSTASSAAVSETLNTTGTLNMDAGNNIISHGNRAMHKVDASSQIDYAANESSGTMTLVISTLGCLMTSRSEP